MSAAEIAVVSLAVFSMIFMVFGYVFVFFYLLPRKRRTLAELERQFPCRCEGGDNTIVDGWCMHCGRRVRRD